jgi:acetyl esterase/lipase
VTLRLGLLAAFLALASPAAGAEAGRIFRDVSYGPLEVNRLDLWLPEEGAEPHPVAVYFHGGAFGAFDKRRFDGALRESLLSRGFAVASVDYRQAPEARFPGPMEDAVRSVQFLRAHAAEWGLDPGRFMTLGRSAGGALALWVAYSDDQARPQAPDAVERQSSRVQAVGVIDAQTTFRMRDLRALFGATRPPRFYHRLLGPEPDPKEAAMASPLVAFSQDDPPTFFIYIAEHSERVVPSQPNSFVHSRRFAEPIEERGASLGVEIVVAETPKRDLRAAYQEMTRFLADRID